ncbi:hypothetical protein, partial [Microbacterium paulum]|uniref:hypothetical protein n=1 Tax=Microbacterium paulum TaxID=2707006 RepID=UPI0019D65E9A
MTPESAQRPTVCDDVPQADVLRTRRSGRSVAARGYDFWTEFLRSLRDRGLKVATDADPLGVALVTSDAHAG